MIARLPVKHRSSLPNRGYSFGNVACRTLLIGVLSTTVCGCATIDFYAQAIAGQFEIWRKQEPIDEVIGNPSVAPNDRRKLELVVAARDFAFSRLDLPDNGSYRDFVRLDREYVVWNVFAAPALSLQPEESCFLLVGCLDYRGYFAREQAVRYADERRAGGLDVHVAGVAAYSTLGWFDDPVLSTILAWDDLRIVEILFHELAHQRLYVADDTSFNESFAVAVADAGLELWLAELDQRPADARTSARRGRDLMALIMETRGELEAVYAGELPDARKLEEKTRIFAAQFERYEALKLRWGGINDYDHWMEQPWNNAKMSSIVTYNEWVPAFRALFDDFDGDWTTAYTAAAVIAGLEPAARRRCLRGFLEGEAVRTCPPGVSKRRPTRR